MEENKKISNLLALFDTLSDKEKQIVSNQILHEVKKGGKKNEK